MADFSKLRHKSGTSDDKEKRSMNLQAAELPPHPVLRTDANIKMTNFYGGAMFRNNIVEQIIEQRHPITCNGKYWLYETAYGYYKYYNKKMLAAVIDKFLPCEESNTYNVAEIIAGIERKCEVGKVNFNRGYDVVNFSNCAVQLNEELEIIDHSYRMLFNYSLNVQIANNCDEFEDTKFGKSIYKLLGNDENSFKRFQEFCGVTITRLPVKGGMFIVGNIDSINASAIMMLRAIINIDALAAVDFESFSTDKAIMRLKDKYVNIGGCSSKSSTESLQKFKSLSNGFPVYVGQALEVIKCSFLFVGKSLPEIIPGNEEMYDLMHVLYIDSERDKIKGFNKSNVESFVLWALRGAVRYIKNGYKFTIDENSSDYLIKHRYNCNSSMAFVVECLESDYSANKESNDDIYNRYIDFCLNFNLNISNRETLFRTILGSIASASLARKSINGHRVRAIRGIRFVMNDDES